ncbi:hypothetical protein [Gayadomonas joobiniege]|uniref:hypothetical protein n=1 Tax=Gayadomonas joobiniege TaxID=1234606 RepID=UPI00037DDF9F|nr:hypothetical protein [Gayadomonas joobiniege]
MKKLTIASCLLAALAGGQTVTAQAASNDQIYTKLLEKLKKSYVSLMITERQTEHLRDSFLQCQQKEVSFEQKQQQLQQQLDRQQSIFNSANSSAEMQIAEREKMALESKQKDLDKRRQECSSLNENFASYESELKKEAAYYQHETSTIQDKIVEHLSTRHLVLAPSMSQSIDYPCQDDNQQACLTKATNAAVNQISLQRTAQRLAGTEFSEHFSPDSSVKLTEPEKFARIKVTDAEYRKTDTGHLYNVTVNARFKTQSQQQQNELDSLRIEAAVEKYLQALKKKFNANGQ